MVYDSEKIVIGKKQTMRAISKNEAQIVYVSRDADAHLIKPVVDACVSSKIEIIYFDNMKELGAFLGINVNAAAAAVLNRFII